MSDNPAFLWRPQNATATFEGYNTRNPYVVPSLVKELYLQSIKPPTPDAPSDSESPIANNGASELLPDAN